MSKVTKFLKRLLYWDIEAYMCFRKRPEKTLRYPLNSSLSDEDWEIRVVDPSDRKDLERLAELFCEAYTSCATPEKARSEISQAFSNGDICFVLANQSEFSAMVWLGLEHNHMLKSAGGFIKNKTNVCVDHRSYASPKIRGLGVQKSINSLLSNHAWNESKDWIYGFVGVKNTASINNCLKSFDEVRLVYYLRIELPKLKFNFYPKLHNERWQRIIR